LKQFSEAGMPCLRLNRFSAAGVALALMTGACGAKAPMVFECPADADTGKPALTLTFDGEMLTYTEAGLPVALPATLQEDSSGAFGISAWGAAVAPMPDMAALEACVAEMSAEYNLDVIDSASITYQVNSCALAMVGELTAQDAQIGVTINSFEPGIADVFLTRTYAAVGSLVSDPIEIPEFPTRTCALAVE
jgi:hypothetical protein